MPSRSFRTVCVQCRTVDQPQRCNHELITVTPKWRPPRKDNDQAWRAVAEGKLMWDDDAVVRSEVRRAALVTAAEQRLRENKHTARART